jgi:pimeloyl-ACP methyl ester carboxylesterase
MSKLQLQTSATADQSSYSMAAPALGLSHPSRSFSAPQGDFRVLSPTHPGFDGTPRPDWLTTIGGLAEVYDKLLDQLQFSDVAVISSSIGGGIAAELAIRGSPKLSGAVLADAVGILVEGHPMADAFSLTLDQLTQLSYHNPAKFHIDLSSFTDAQRQAIGANRAALAVYGGMLHCPTQLSLAGPTT